MVRAVGSLTQTSILIHRVPLGPNSWPTWASVLFGGENNVRNIALLTTSQRLKFRFDSILDEQKRQAAEMTSRLEDQIVNQNVAIKKLRDQLNAQDSLNKHIPILKPAVRYLLPRKR